MKGRSIIFYFSLLLAITIKIPSFAQLQSAELISKFFPNPTIAINTPGFSKSEGFMNYSEMMSYLENLVNKRSDIVSIKYTGASILGKRIPVVFVEKNSKSAKVKIWMQGGLHGNEPAGTESLLMYIDDLLKAKNIDSILNFVSFAIVPMANIDGYEKQVRDNVNNEDLNRDQVKLEQVESVYLKQAFTNFAPAVAIDFHEFRPIRKELNKFSTEKLSISQDVLFLPSGNLNIPEELRNLTNQLYLSNIKAELTKNQITFNDYFVPGTRKNGVNYLRIGGDSPRSSSTSYGLTNAVSILFEIRGIGLDHDSYKRRVYSGFLIAKSVLETTLRNHDRVLKIVESSNRETIERRKPIVIESNPLVYQGTMNFIDINNLKYLPLNVEIEDAGHSKAISYRKRPKAYILLAEDTKIVRKLQILGLKTDTLKSDLLLKTEVFALKINTKGTGSTLDSTIQITTQNRLFPKGSFVISTAQKNANIAISTLEPEMENGFYKYKMIKAKQNGEIPIYRCMTNISKTK
jgi:hypothetical protein